LSVNVVPCRILAARLQGESQQRDSVLVPVVPSRLFRGLTQDAHRPGLRSGPVREQVFGHFFGRRTVRVEQFGCATA
jgi:hypothetical protein